MSAMIGMDSEWQQQSERRRRDHAVKALSVLGPGIDWALFRLLSSREALGAESEEPVSVGNDRNRLGSAATVGAAP